MKYSSYKYFILLSFPLLFVGCGDNPIRDSYKSMLKTAEQGSAGGPESGQLGKLGNTIITSRSFLYADSADRLLDSSYIETLSPGARRLLIRKLLLRKRIVSLGIKENVFDDPAAVRYILPQLERAMEEYYLQKKADYQGHMARARALDPGNASVKALMKKNPNARFSERDLMREKNRLIRALARRNYRRARLQVIQRILKDSPPMELSQ